MQKNDKKNILGTLEEADKLINELISSPQNVTLGYVSTVRGDIAKARRLLMDDMGYTRP